MMKIISTIDSNVYYVASFHSLVLFDPELDELPQDHSTNSPSKTSIYSIPELPPPSMSVCRPFKVPRRNNDGSPTVPSPVMMKSPPKPLPPPPRPSSSISQPTRSITKNNSIISQAMTLSKPVTLPSPQKSYKRPITVHFKPPEEPVSIPLSSPPNPKRVSSLPNPILHHYNQTLSNFKQKSTISNSFNANNEIDVFIQKLSSKQQQASGDDQESNLREKSLESICAFKSNLPKRNRFSLSNSVEKKTVKNSSKQLTLNHLFEKMSLSLEHINDDYKNHTLCLFCFYN